MFDTLIEPKQGKHLIYLGRIVTQLGQKKSKTLIDYRGTLCFTYRGFVRVHKLLTIKLPRFKRLRLVDRHILRLIYTVQITYTIGDYTDRTLYYITDLDQYDLVLGMSQLEEHDLTISFIKRTILFSLGTYYKQHCYARRPYSIIVDTYGRTRSQSPLLEAQLLASPSKADKDIYTISTDTFLRIVRRNRKRVHRAVYDLGGNDRLFILQLEDLKANKDTVEHVSTFTISPEDIKKFIDSSTKTDPLTKLPQRYHYLANAFRYKTNQKILAYGPSDYTIILKLGEQPPFKRGYAMSG